MEVSGHLHDPVAVAPVGKPSTRWIEGWVGPRADLGVLEKRISEFYSMFGMFCATSLSSQRQLCFLLLVRGMEIRSRKQNSSVAYRLMS